MLRPQTRRSMYGRLVQPAEPPDALGRPSARGGGIPGRTRAKWGREQPWTLLQLCAVYTFDGQDRLAGERIYYDRTTVLRQLGVVSEPTSLKGRLGALLLHPVNVIPALLGIRRKADGAASAQH